MRACEKNLIISMSYNVLMILTGEVNNTYVYIYIYIYIYMFTYGRVKL